MRARLARLARVAAVVLVSVHGAVSLAATVTVTGTGDTVAVDGLVTLREAVASVNGGANVNADVLAAGTYGSNDTIVFSIPGAGVHTIAPASAYTLSVPVTIDGYSQPGASANTNGPSQGTNAVLLIELNLSAISGGISVNGGNSTIRGLVLNRSATNAISLASGNNTVAGNFIGTNPTGAAAGPGNAGDGVFVSGTANVIGGTSPADRNLISANGWGLRITTGGNIVQGNLVGTIAAGTFALGNTGQGIGANGASNTIGGGSAAERNIVSGNGQHGILVTGSNSLIAGNYVGTEVAGGSGIANGQDGIHVDGPNNTVGGLGGFGNLVSGNGGHGIMISNQSPGGATVTGNTVGATASGTLPIGGQINGGIEIGPFSNDNTVFRNLIAFNLGVGVFVAGEGLTGGNRNTISENSIHGNGLLGIKLGAPPNATATPNDAGDADTGPNGLQNYPVVTSGTISGGVLTVGGTFNSVPNAQFTIEVFVSQFCDGNLFGEGQTFVGNFGVGTDAAGNASFGSLNFPAVPAGQAVVTMTATNDSTGDTSEFSACFLASGPPPTISINDVSQVEGNAGTTNFVYTVTISAAADATVNFATADGTATAGSDYVATSGTVTFTAGGPTTQTVTVAVNGDTVVEPNETFLVNLSNASGATIADGQGVGTIVDDDATPAAAIPTLGEWQLALLMLLLATFAWRRVRGRP